MRHSRIRCQFSWIAVALACPTFAPRRCDAQVVPPEPQVILGGRAGQIHSLAFSPDGTMVVVGGNDGKVKLWDPAARRLLAEGPLREGLKPGDPALIVRHAVFSADGRTIVSADREGLIQPWAVRLGQGPPTLIPRDFFAVDSLFRILALSRDGRLLASSRGSNTISLQDTDTGRVLAELSTRLKLTNFFLRTLAISPDAKTLAGGGFASSKDELLAGVIQVWDLGDRRLRTILRSAHETSGSTCLAFAPDASTLAAVGAAEVVQWDLATRRPRTLDKARELLTCLAYAPDGTLLAAGGWDETVTIWDLASGAVAAEFRTQEGKAPAPSPSGLHARRMRTLGAVRCVAFSPDGKRLATGGETDGIVRLWDVDALLAIKAGR